VDLSGIGKMLLIAGAALAAVGAVFLLSSKIGWIGRLPGDIVIQRKNFTFYFPLATCILASLLLSLLLWILRK